MSDEEDVSVQNKPKKKKRTQRVIFWAADCWYSVVKERVKQLGWKSVEDEKLDSKANLFWVDCSKLHDRLKIMQPWQVMNHFPGMPNIARKTSMGQNLNRMLKMFPKEYAFYPRTWILPNQMSDFRNQFDSHNNTLDNKIFIVKPDAGCQGRGIFLTKSLDKIPVGENVVAQMYLKNPLLIDGYKFDLRIYCFVASVKPLRVYLFQDGLVRMCTQEYVRPSKDNIEQSCMHLTNYAVNKHNDNFQQPDDDDGDSGSKRSLQWFMDWIREEHGNDKADWLWKRIGTLCMRTLLAIIPVLSREYDQHFKSFTGVPVDRSEIGKSKSSESLSKDSNTGDTEGKDSVHASDIEQEEEDTGVHSAASSFKQKTVPITTKEGTSLATATVEEGHEEQMPANAGPKMRGSRCFEVLGYDVMVDSNLNPWIIEVNHLPSFGTDSPMDKDIKERLMEQVFSVLPVLPDDQQAYAAYHKAESEKRLVAQNRISALAKKEKEAKEREAKEKAKSLSRRPPRRKSADGAESITHQPGQQEGKLSSSRSTASGGDSAEDQNLPCTAERIAEIKALLLDIYTDHCPEKINSVDYLLHKYASREEEFLQFVRRKYNIEDPEQENVPAEIVGNKQSDSDKPPVLEEHRIEQDGAVEQDEERSGAVEVEESAERGQSSPAGGRDYGCGSRDRKADASSPHRHHQAGKRMSRSMSPIRSNAGSMFSTTTNTSNSNTGLQNGSKRAWKGTEEEDAKFRAEVLAMHVPREDDEWLLYETAKLTQFTRLYPPVRKSRYPVATATSRAAEGGPLSSSTLQPGEEEEEGDEEETAGPAASSSAKQNNSTAGTGREKFKAASYEEIMFQAFLKDKHQGMRLHNPLPYRSKSSLDDPSSNSSSFLPPLDISKPPFSSFGNSGKGIVGWKAPPKPEKEAYVREPGVGQIDAAKRLSQGLSVTELKQPSVRTRAERGPTRFPVVLERHGAAAADQSARSTAVIRQQMFFFDPNYRDQMLGLDGLPQQQQSSNGTECAAVGGAAAVLSTGAGNQHQQQTSGRRVVEGTGRAAGAGGGGYVRMNGLDAFGSVMDDTTSVGMRGGAAAGHAQQQQRFGVGAFTPTIPLQQHQQQRYNVARHVNNSTSGTGNSAQQYQPPKKSYTMYKDYNYSL